jgi:hypothetical protein
MARMKLRGVVPEARAWLNVFGVGLDIGEISDALKVRASDTHRAGDPAPSGTPLPRDLWSVGSPLPRTEPLDSHIKWLIRSLQPGYALLRSLKDKAEVRSFCGILIEGDSASFRVSAEALKLFVELGVDFELSLIFVGYSDGQSAAPELPTPECDSDTYRTEARVFFDLRGNSKDVAEAWGALGGKPSEVHHAGEVDTWGNPYLTDQWSLAAPVGPGEELDRHLKWLADFLLRHADSIRSLTGDIEALVRCDFGTESDNGGLGISAQALRAPVDLDLPFHFNVRLI